MIRLEENRNDSGSLDNPAGRGMRVEIRHAVPETTLRWMTFLQVFLALLVERFRPRQHGNIHSTSAEVLEIFAVGGPPDSGQIRLATRGLRHRGREVRFSVRRSRNPRSGIVQPLRGEWNEGRKKDDNSPNRPRNGHVSLPLDAVYMLLQYASKPTFSSIFAKVLAAKCANDANGPHAINPVGNDRNSVRPIRVIRARFWLRPPSAVIYWWTLSLLG